MNAQAQTPPEPAKPKAKSKGLFHQTKKQKKDQEEKLAAKRAAKRAAQSPHIPPRGAQPHAGPAGFAERPQSPAPTVEPRIFPIYTTKRALLEGLRFHVARLNSKELVDVTDESTFTRPIRLHRRDPRITVGGDGMDLDSKDDLLNEQEREKLEIAKAARQAQREENAKLMAPTAPSKKKPQAFKKKVEQVYRTEDNPDDRKRSQLRYEEALPWHLEDFDNKHTWQGFYEAALSGCHVALLQCNEIRDAQDVVVRDSHLKLVPMEKWYRFREKSKAKIKFTGDIDTLMNKKFKEPSIILKHEIDERKRKLWEADANKTRGLFQRNGGREEKEIKEDELFGGDRADGADDIDFDLNEEFADDDENPIFEGDDDTQKQAEERVKRDQLAANVFGMTDEQQVDAEAEKEKKAAELAKQGVKGTSKILVKRERNYDYEDDSDGNPYESSSEEEDSDVERQKEEELKKAEADKQKEKEKSERPHPTSGANTPSGRQEKQNEAARKSQIPSLKRPGSPNLSDASGNESSRKKIKKEHGLPNRLAGGMSPRPTPSGSRATSPVRGDGGASSRQASPAVASVALPTKEAILAKIPEDGISIKELAGIFKAKAMNRDTQKAFTQLVGGLITKDKVSGLLRKRE
ncbi:Transcription Factor IIF Rap30/Rap74 interaction [Venturia nashicola]|uniref:Transcription Factor IIF Rap30/Rap74 interaction n=1 Tax=Venturia nashicola TaxID=86259 RepID=A0A4Z1PN22_9PEZI|nr:Transcription Factor IIF Rap30/Rap74 interaction [Venturia nashicola]TLD37412.1 Transcription Factor IIF Rap30/Rap74 interaction [Venturia nashicola]